MRALSTHNLLVKLIAFASPKVHSIYFAFFFCFGMNLCVCLCLRARELPLFFFHSLCVKFRSEKSSTYSHCCIFTWWISSVSAIIAGIIHLKNSWITLCMRRIMSFYMKCILRIWQKNPRNAYEFYEVNSQSTQMKMYDAKIEFNMSFKASSCLYFVTVPRKCYHMQWLWIWLLLLHL